MYRKELIIMSKKEFKAESKRVLDLMINSIYTNKEIFLRELISNASDAIDKLYYRSLTKKDVTLNQSSLEMDLKLDKENKNIIIKDNGCGMTREELIDGMKYGSTSTLTKDPRRLGKFGLGLKTASTAFCRRERNTTIIRLILCPFPPCCSA